MGSTKQYILLLVWFVWSIIWFVARVHFGSVFGRLTSSVLFSHLLGDGGKRRSIPAGSEMSAGCCLGLTGVNLLENNYQVPRVLSLWVTFCFRSPCPPLRE